MSEIGHSLPIHSTPVPNNVRCYSNSDRFLRRSEMARCAKNDQSHLCARSPFLRLLIPNLRTLYPGNVLLLNNVR
jgi:hypothetical protein